MSFDPASLRQAWPTPSHPKPIVTIGAGSIVADAHFPAYRKAGFPIAGVYDIRQHRDDVVAPVLRYWNVFELEGLGEEGEQARTELADFMEELEKQALRFEEKRDKLQARMAARAAR